MKQKNVLLLRTEIVLNEKYFVKYTAVLLIY